MISKLDFKHLFHVKKILLWLMHLDLSLPFLYCSNQRMTRIQPHHTALS